MEHAKHGIVRGDAPSAKRNKPDKDLKERSSDAISIELETMKVTEDEVFPATFVVRGLTDDAGNCPYYNGIKAMINALTSQMDKKVVSSDIATAISEQGNLGGVAGQEGDEDYDIFGFYSMLSFAQWRKPLKGLISFINKCIEKNGMEPFKTMWKNGVMNARENGDTSEYNIGLWVCMKAQNVPIPVLFDMYNSALQDIKWSLDVQDPEVGMTEEERRYYTYSHVLTIFPVYLMNALSKNVEDQSDDFVFCSIDNEVLWNSSESNLRVLLPRNTMTEIVVPESPESGEHVKAHDYLAIIIMPFNLFEAAVTLIETHATIVQQTKTK
eukprot:GHVH01004937.1.p1 GENE.GHVH01004937.1~~GHVH01004937.1.p1  ORF type:complete len:336 (-),score=50.48 GHVH01004937.1:433-1410(-)